MALYFLSGAIATSSELLNLGVRTILLAGFIGAAVHFEHIPLPNLSKLKKS